MADINIQDGATDRKQISCKPYRCIIARQHHPA
jgi:hypothetical protein